MTSPDTQDDAAPLVTLVILAFNQQHYVRGALAAALAQSYPHLEIIFSDDGSSDDTLQTAEQVAAAYHGPHRLTVRRTPANRGVLAHVFDVAREARGELLIIAAADDLCRPDRVAATVTAFRETGCDALFGKYDIIDDAGTTIRSDTRIDLNWLPLNDYFPGREVVPIHGASSAYRRALFLDLPEPDQRVMFEDTWMTLMLTHRGKTIAYLDQVLVAYRQHQASMTNSRQGRSGRAASTQVAAQRLYGAYAETIRSFLGIAGSTDGVNRPDLGLIAHDLRFFEAQAQWDRLSFARRVAVGLSVRQGWMRRWVAARLFGYRVFNWIDVARSLRRQLTRLPGR